MEGGCGQIGLASYRRQSFLVYEDAGRVGAETAEPGQLATPENVRMPAWDDEKVASGPWSREHQRACAATASPSSQGLRPEERHAHGVCPDED